MDYVRTSRVSSSVAEVDPLTIRSSNDGRRRLIFIPTFVRNPNNEQASVSGTFRYQVRSGPDAIWTSVEPINLNSVKQGEEVRLNLNSGELLELFEMLRDLYALIDQHGLMDGNTVFIPFVGDSDADLGSVVSKLGQKRFSSQAVKLISEQSVAALADALYDGSSGSALNTFTAAAGLARIRTFLKEYDDGSSTSAESFWQALFERNTWVLSQACASPIVFVRREAYVGGKNVANRKGNFADFLFKSTGTDNATLIEFKTPQTELFVGEYRNNTLSPSPALSSGILQALIQRDSLTREYKSLVDLEKPEFRAFSPRAVLVIGEISSLTDREARHCFEQFRTNSREVEIITFDELRSKAELLMQLFSQVS